MAKKIESYNASYPLAYYSVGTVYSFYGYARSTNQASPEQVVKYASKLKELDQSSSSNAIQPVGAHSSTQTSTDPNKMQRFYAVVVDKISGSTSKIVVMFINKGDLGDSYLLKQYAVSTSAGMDGKDVMPVSSHLQINGIAGTIPKVGGITHASNIIDISAPKVGGITRAQKATEGSTAASYGVGGITRANHAPTESPEKTSQPRIGGITRAKK